VLAPSRREGWGALQKKKKDPEREKGIFFRSLAAEGGKKVWA